MLTSNNSTNHGIQKCRVHFAQISQQPGLFSFYVPLSADWESYRIEKLGGDRPKALQHPDNTNPIVRGPTLKRAQNQGRCSDFNSRTFLFLETVASNLLSTIFHVGIFAFGRLQQERTKSVALSNGRRRLSR